jgi:glycosyltransferase involved in cell wall biosynthesis
MRAAFDLPGLWRLYRLVSTHGVDLVHTHSSIDSWLAGVAARARGVPVVRSRHVSIPIRRSLVYRLADRIITSGENVRAIVAGAGIPDDRIVAVAPGVDTTRFQPGVCGRAVRDELGLRGPVIGLVANIRGSKGHDVFLGAAGEILRRRPDAQFLIAGDGVGFENVRQRVRALGLERAVVMTGFRRDIPEVLAALDVLTLPSLRSEASSQVIAQALAIGRPVVASNVGGNPELVRDGQTGRLVPAGDAAALAGAVLGLLADPADAARLASAGQALVRERYSLDAAMGRTVAVYRDLLDR